MPDLITADYAAARLNLDAARQANLPDAIASVSRLIRTHTGRHLSRRAVIDETYTPEYRAPLLLNEYPVNAVLRVATDPIPGLILENQSAAVQRAEAEIREAGDEVAGFAPTGLRLGWTASGVTTGAVIAYADLPSPTIAALAQAVNAVGSGWSARYPADFGLWAVAELATGQGTRPARNTRAAFRLFSRDIAYRFDRRAGYITLDQDANSDPFHSPRWGYAEGIDFGDDRIREESRGVRVVYDAGYDPIPEDLQQAALEGVKSLFERLRRDATLRRERIDTWEIELSQFINGLPPATLDVLAYYRDHTR